MNAFVILWVLALVAVVTTMAAAAVLVMNELRSLEDSKVKVKPIAQKDEWSSWVAPEGDPDEDWLEYVGQNTKDGKLS